MFFLYAAANQLFILARQIVRRRRTDIMFLTAAVVQVAVKKLSIRTIFLLGSAGTGLSMLAIAIAVYGSTADLLIFAALMAGVDQGLAQFAALAAVYVAKALPNAG